MPVVAVKMAKGRDIETKEGWQLRSIKFWFLF